MPCATRREARRHAYSSVPVPVPNQNLTVPYQYVLLSFFQLLQRPDRHFVAGIYRLCRTRPDGPVEYCRYGRWPRKVSARVCAQVGRGIRDEDIRELGVCPVVGWDDEQASISRSNLGKCQSANSRQ